MLTERLLLEIHGHLSVAFAESVVQEVVLRLWERRANELVLNWQGYALVSARHLKWEKENKAKYHADITADISESEKGEHASCLTPATLRDSIERQLIAREDLRRVTSSERGIKIMRYVLLNDRWCSRQRLKQLRDELREEME